MLPPSDSDEDSDTEEVPVKAKQVVTTQVSRAASCSFICKYHIMLMLQPATAGMLPPSDSEEESSSGEEEDVKAKPSPAGKPPRPAVAAAPKKYACSHVSTAVSAITFIYCLAIYRCLQ